MKKVSAAEVRLGVTYQVMCLEMGRNCANFGARNSLFFVPNSELIREVALDGIGVYDLVDGSKITAIVYQIIVYGLGVSDFSNVSTYRHDFSQDVFISAEEFPARLLAASTLIAMHDAKTVLPDVPNIDGDLMQFVE